MNLDDLARPENFGAKGDGSTDDTAAFRTCLLRHRRLSLGPKTYLIDGRNGGVPVYSDTLIAGCGPNQTRLIVDGEAAAGSWALAFQTGDYERTPSDGVTIRDLWIDCGYSRFQNNFLTRQAINLRGTNNLVENVKFTNFGVGRSGYECFVCTLQLSPGNAGSTCLPGSIRGCQFTQPGLNGKVAYPGHIAEITCTLLQGLGNTQLAVGGSISNNRFFDMGFDDTQRSPLHAMTVAMTDKAEMRDNELTNFDGVCVFMMSWQTQNTFIRGNRMLNVMHGVNLNISNWATIENSDDAHRNVHILDNQIFLGAWKAAVFADGRRGINLFIASDVKPPKIRLENIFIRGNYIHGRKIGADVPFGVLAYLNAPFYRNVVIADNTFDLPDLGTQFDMGQASENSVAYLPRWSYRAEDIKTARNRTIDESDAKLKIVADDFKTSSFA